MQITALYLTKYKKIRKSIDDNIVDVYKMIRVSKNKLSRKKVICIMKNYRELIKQKPVKGFVCDSCRKKSECERLFMEGSL